MLNNHFPPKNVKKYQLISEICNETISGNGSSVNSRISSTFNSPLPASIPDLLSKVIE